MVVDPQAQMLGELKPAAVVDAILAKRNLGTTRDMAPAVIAVGPGFTAPVDCDAVIETMRGHFLGRVITQDSPQPNTGVPGVIAGYGKERVIHSPAVGVFRSDRAIGDIVSAGDVIGYAGDTPMVTQIDGCLRGLLADGVQVTEGFKCADVDPRGDASYINYISDKATSVGGGKIELFALDEARELLAGGKSRLVRYTMGGENSDTGMICGGAICTWTRPRRRCSSRLPTSWRIDVSATSSSTLNRLSSKPSRATLPSTMARNRATPLRAAPGFRWWRRGVRSPTPTPPPRFTRRTSRRSAPRRSPSP